MANKLTHKVRNPKYNNTNTPADQANDIWIDVYNIQNDQINLHGKLNDKDSVTTSNIIDKAITTEKIADGAITANQITTTAAVITTATQIATATTTSSVITNDHFLENSISGTKILNDSILGSKIVPSSTDGSIFKSTGVKIPTGLIDSNSFTDNSITLNKLNTKLKGILISSIDPDNMISSGLNETKILINKTDIEPCEFTFTKDSVLYKGAVSFENSAVITFKYSSEDNIDYEITFNPVKFFVAFANNDYENYSIDSILLSSGAQTLFVTKDTNNFNFFSFDYFNNLIQEYGKRLKDFLEDDNIETIDSSTLDSFFNSNSWTSFENTSPRNWREDSETDATNLDDPTWILYSSREEFEEAMFISQADYDNIGIWIKI